MSLLGLIRGSLTKYIENVTKSESNFAPTFVGRHLLLYITFNGHCLIKINISIPKKVINLYISYTIIAWLRKLNTVYIKEMPIWIFKAN